jgi:hypothetical protein
VSPSNTFLIDMTAAAKALGDYTATYATTSTLAVPGHAIGFAAATAVAQDPAPRTSAETTGHVTHGDIISWHALELSIDFPYGPTPVSVDMSITTLSSHAAAMSFRGIRCPTSAARRCTVCSEARQRLRPKVVVLESTQARAAHETLVQQLSLLARKARHEAEPAGLARIEWPAELRAAHSPTSSPSSMPSRK